MGINNVSWRFIVPQETQIIENDTQEYHNRAHYGYESNKDIPNIKN